MNPKHVTTRCCQQLESVAKVRNPSHSHTKLSYDFSRGPEH